MIWFDRTQRSIVVGCRACGARDVMLDQRTADSWAARHVERAHPVVDRTVELAASITASQASQRQRRARDGR